MVSVDHASSNWPQMSSAADKLLVILAYTLSRFQFQFHYMSSVVCSELVTFAGLQITFSFWKDVCPAKSLFCSDKTEMWSDAENNTLPLGSETKDKLRTWLKKTSFFLSFFGKNDVQALCPTTVRLWSEMSKFCSADDRLLFAALLLGWRPNLRKMQNSYLHRRNFWVSLWRISLVQRHGYHRLILRRLMCLLCVTLRTRIIINNTVHNIFRWFQHGRVLWWACCIKHHCSRVSLNKIKIWCLKDRVT